MSTKIPKPQFSAPVPNLLDLMEAMGQNEITHDQSSYEKFKSVTRSRAHNVGLGPSETVKKIARYSASTTAKTEQSVKWAEFVSQVTAEYPELNEYNDCWPLEVYYDNWIHHWRPPERRLQKLSESSTRPVQRPKSQVQSNRRRKSGPADAPTTLQPRSVDVPSETSPSGTGSVTDPAASPPGKDQRFVLPLLKPLPSTHWKIARLPAEEDVHLIPSTCDHRKLASLMKKTEAQYWDLKMMLKFTFQTHFDVTLEQVHWCEVNDIKWRSFVNVACHKDMTLLEYEELWPLEFCIRPYMKQD